MKLLFVVLALASALVVPEHQLKIKAGDWRLFGSLSLLSGVSLERPRHNATWWTAFATPSGVVALKASKLAEFEEVKKKEKEKKKYL
jgi:hypothetical protein